MILSMPISKFKKKEITVKVNCNDYINHIWNGLQQISNKIIAFKSLPYYVIYA